MSNNKRFLSLPGRVSASGGVVLMLAIVISLGSIQSWAGAGAEAGKSSANSGLNTTQGGFMSTGKPARDVNLGGLPQITEQQLAARPDQRLRPLDGLTDEQYWARKRQAREMALAGLVGAKSSALGSNTVLKSANSEPPSVGAFVGWDAQQEICCTPPDMALAVGTNFVLQVVNDFVAVYDKRGNLQPGFPKSADTFWGLAGGTYTTDPRAFYDWTNHRFVIVMLTESNPFNPNGPANVGGLLIATSRTQDPRGNWWVYSPAIDIGNRGECPDFPTLGHDSSNWGAGATKGGFYVGINQFGGTGICQGSGFIQNYFFMFANDEAYNGASIPFWTQFGLTHGGTLVDTLQPANMTDWADKPSAVLFVNSLNINFDGSNGLVIWSASNPFGWVSGGANPVFAGVNVGTAHNYSFPPGADEPNGNGGVCSQCIDTGDSRISGQVKYHAGELFGSFETAVSGSAEAGPIWFDVHPILNASGNITSAEERQEDCFVCGGWANNGSAYYATLQPDPENNLVMVFDHSTDAEYPTTAYTSRRATFGDSLMNGAGIALQFGQAFYAQLCNKSGQFCRWGDYTATAPDLTIASQPSMWFAGQYTNSGGNWGTAIGAARYATPANQ
jgi:hypothetical protein